jgi:hypothetical protein
MRTATFDRLRRLLADGGWHSQRELSQVVQFPELWIRELAAERVIEVSSDDHEVKIRRSQDWVEQPAA